MEGLSGVCEKQESKRKKGVRLFLYQNASGVVGGCSSGRHTQSKERSECYERVVHKAPPRTATVILSSPRAAAGGHIIARALTAALSWALRVDGRRAKEKDKGEETRGEKRNKRGCEITSGRKRRLVHCLQVQK